MKIRKGSKLTPSQKEFVEDLKHSLEQVELYLQGKIQLQDAFEFLEELKREELDKNRNVYCGGRNPIGI